MQFIEALVPSGNGALHSEEAGLDWLCNVPATGDWVIQRNCTVDEEVSPPGNVEVKTPHKLNITATGALSMDSKIKDFLRPKHAPWRVRASPTTTCSSGQVRKCWWMLLRR